MPLCLLRCSSPPSVAEHHTNTLTFGDHNALPPPSSLLAKAYTDSGSSSASSAGGAASFRTLLSLPSLQSLLPLSSSTTLPSASYNCLSAFEPPHSGCGSATALAVASSSLLLYCASDTDISVIDLVSLCTVESFDAVPSAGSVKSVALSPDGRTAFTAHQDGRIRVWRRSNSGRHRLAATLPTTADRLRRFPLPGNYVTVRRHRRSLWIEHADAVSGLAVACVGLLYSVSWDKTLKVWRTDGNLRCLESVRAHDDAVNAVAVAGDGTIYTGSADGRIRIWKLPPESGEKGRQRKRKKHELVATLEGHRSAVNAVAVNGDGALVYSAGCDRLILVWKREGTTSHVALAGALRGHTSAVLCLATDGDVVFSGGSDRTVRIWLRNRDDDRRSEAGRRTGYTCLAVMEGHVSVVRSLEAVRMLQESASDGEEEYRVCSGSLDGEVRIWKVRIAGTRGSDTCSERVSENEFEPEG